MKFKQFKQSNLLEWNFKPEIKIGIKTIKTEIKTIKTEIKTIKTEIKTIILKSEWKLKRNKKEKKMILEIYTRKQKRK